MSLEDDLAEFLESIDRSRSHGTSVKHQLSTDFISFPRITTIVRRWALTLEHVQRVVLSRSNDEYSLAVLIHPCTVDLIQTTNCEMRLLLQDEFNTSIPQTYVVGNEFEDAPMFKKLGMEVIIDKGGALHPPAPEKEND